MDTSGHVVSVTSGGRPATEILRLQPCRSRKNGTKTWGKNTETGRENIYHISPASDSQHLASCWVPGWPVPANS